MSTAVAATDVTHQCRASSHEVAALIRCERESQGLTQHQLALRMGSTQSMVARWEAGEHEITMTTLTRVATALGVELLVRFGGQQVATA